MEVTPRYEFRVWGNDLADVASGIVAASEATDVRETTEFYLPVRTSLELNPKIRRDVLDVKLLLDRSRGCEQWKPIAQWSFPITGAQLDEHFFPLLHTATPELARENYRVAEFISEVIEPHEEIRTVELFKRRSIYRTDTCLAEVSEVTMLGDTTQTVAIESTDLEALVALREHVGLDSYENRSYPRAIHAALGWLDD